MTFITADDFKGLLRTENLDGIADDYVLGGEAYCFRKNPQDYKLMRELLAKEIGLTEDSITMVGSGKVGFSLDPKNTFIAYTPTRDIDVVIVDAQLFDTFWSNLIAWSYPLQGSLAPNDWKWFSTHKNDVFWGYFYPGLRLPRSPALPALISPIQKLYTIWRTAFLALGRYRAFTGLSIDGRLYRTWSHAKAYHVEGLRLILSELQEKQGKS